TAERFDYVGFDGNVHRQVINQKTTGPVWLKSPAARSQLEGVITSYSEETKPVGPEIPVKNWLQDISTCPTSFSGSTGLGFFGPPRIEAGLTSGSPGMTLNIPEYNQKNSQHDNLNVPISQKIFESHINLSFPGSTSVPGPINIQQSYDSQNHSQRKSGVNNITDQLSAHTDYFAAKYSANNKQSIPELTALINPNIVSQADEWTSELGEISSNPNQPAAKSVNRDEKIAGRITNNDFIQNQFNNAGNILSNNLIPTAHAQEGSVLAVNSGCSPVFAAFLRLIPAQLRPQVAEWLDTTGWQARNFNFLRWIGLLDPRTGKMRWDLVTRFFSADVSYQLVETELRKLIGDKKIEGLIVTELEKKAINQGEVRVVTKENIILRLTDNYRTASYFLPKIDDYSASREELAGINDSDLWNLISNNFRRNLQPDGELNRVVQEFVAGADEFISTEDQGIDDAYNYLAERAGRHYGVGYQFLTKQEKTYLAARYYLLRLQLAEGWLNEKFDDTGKYPVRGNFDAFMAKAKAKEQSIVNTDLERIDGFYNQLDLDFGFPEFEPRIIGRTTSVLNAQYIAYFDVWAEGEISIVAGNIDHEDADGLKALSQHEGMHRLQWESGGKSIGVFLSKYIDTSPIESDGSYSNVEVMTEYISRYLPKLLADEQEIIVFENSYAGGALEFHNLVRDLYDRVGREAYRSALMSAKTALTEGIVGNDRNGVTVKGIKTLYNEVFGSGEYDKRMSKYSDYNFINPLISFSDRSKLFVYPETVKSLPPEFIHSGSKSENAPEFIDVFVGNDLIPDQTFTTKQAFSQTSTKSLTTQVVPANSLEAAAKDWMEDNTACPLSFTGSSGLGFFGPPRIDADKGFEEQELLAGGVSPAFDLISFDHNIGKDHNRDQKESIGNRSISKEIFDFNISNHDLLLSKIQTPSNSPNIPNNALPVNKVSHLSRGFEVNPGAINTTPNHPELRLKQIAANPSRSVLNENSFTGSNANINLINESNFSLIPQAHAQESSVLAANSGCNLVVGSVLRMIPAQYRQQVVNWLNETGWQAPNINVLREIGLVDEQSGNLVLFRLSSESGVEERTIILGETDPLLIDPNNPQGATVLYHGGLKPLQVKLDYDNLTDPDKPDGSVTLGTGLYTSNNQTQAKKYADLRGQSRGGGYLSVVIPYRAKMLDLRGDKPFPEKLFQEWVEYWLVYFEQNKIEYEAKKDKIILDDVIFDANNKYSIFLKKIRQITNNEVKRKIRYVLGTMNIPEYGISQGLGPIQNDVFAKFMRERGFDGIIAPESGDSKIFEEDDSYVFFNYEVIGTKEDWKERRNQSVSTTDLYINSDEINYLT
ncbi:MAG: hypothetical protein AAB874_03585, partial [Patescibacteria group bacterium]